MRREVADRLIPPVVAQPAREQKRVVHERVYGEQLHRGHTKPLQVRNRGRVGQPGIRAPQRFRHVGMKLGEAPDVHLVDDRVRHPPTGPPIIAPIKIAGGSQH